MKNSSLLTWPVREAGTTDLRELRQENLRRKKKKPAKRLPLQEVVSSDSDDPSHGNRSQESYPWRHPKSKEGGGQHHLSPEHPEITLKSSACEITPQFLGQFRSQHTKNPNTLSNADITSPEKGRGAGFRSQPAESSLPHLHLSSPALHS